MKRLMLALGLALGVMTFAACGGGDGGGFDQQLCIDTCEKSNECFGTSSDCEADCSGDNGGNGGMDCNNEGEIADHYDMCNAGECGENGMTYGECLQNAPECEM